MRGLIQAEWIEDAGRFEALRDEWRELLADSASDSLFLTWEWLFTWWKHLAGASRLRILTLREDGRLIAIAPLMRQLRPVLRLVNLRSLRFLGTGSVGSDYLDVILRNGKEAPATESLATHLAGSGEMIELAQVREDHSAASLLAARLYDSSWGASKWRTNVCPFIPLSGRTWESYRAGLGAEHRYSFDRKLRTLERRFSVAFEQVDSEARRGAGLKELVRLHNLRWSARGDSEAFHTPAVVSFHDEFSATALRLGWLGLFLLQLDGEVVAALYGFRYGGVFHFYQSGFDPERARLGVGTVTMGLAIRSAFEQGLNEFDLLHGDEDYKFHWARDTRPLVEHRLEPPGLTGRLAGGALRWERAARKLARRVLPAPVVEVLATGRRAASRGSQHVS